MKFLKTFPCAILIFSFLTLIEEIFKAAELLFFFDASMFSTAKLLLLSFLYTLSFSIPLAVLFSQIMVCATLSARGEVLGMKSCGADLKRLLMPSFLLFLLFFFPLKYLNDEIAPNAKAKLTNLVQKIKEEEISLKEGRFLIFGEKEVWVQRVKGGMLENIYIYEECSGKKRIIFAKMGMLRREKGWNFLLWDGALHLFDPSKPKEYLRMHFREYNISLLEEGSSDVFDVKSLSTYSLKRRSRECKELQIDLPLLQSEIEKRRVLAFAPFPLGIAGAAIGLLCKAGGRIAGFGATALFSFIYYVLFIGIEAFTKTGTPAFFLWLPNILSFSPLFFILRR